MARSAVLQPLSPKDVYVVIGAEKLQHTLAASASCAGVGVHSGDRVRLTIHPAPAGSGVAFVRTDVADRDNRILVSPKAVICTKLNTKVANASGVSVSTIEHVMASLAALKIDNAVIELDGPETPIMDGSALGFVELLDRAGRRSQDASRTFIEILEPVEVVDGDKRAALLPGYDFEMALEIAFPSTAIGRQQLDMVVTEQSFREELAAARTFGFIHEVDALRSAGLARGGSHDNVIVIDGDTVLNDGGLRFENEFVRHKMLDAIGDLYVLGAPLIGRFEARYTGHALNNALARTLMASPQAWRLVSGPARGTRLAASGSRIGGANDRCERRAGAR
jgi:UDP-3-O-[3-hydroxymyristoyl] N-acetylglucosamine deacetylase